jgi:cytochrome c oxidase assembly factor CtaG
VTVAAAPDLLALPFTDWHPDPGVCVPAAAWAGLYLWGVVRARGRWPARRTAAFLAGVACVVTALQSGLERYDSRLLSAHMVQHMLLLIAAPGLLVAGRPAILALRSLPRAQRAALLGAMARMRPVTRPVVCLAAFTAVVLATHLTGFYDTALRDPTVHAGEHVLYLTAGLLLWWPLLDGDPVPAHRLGGLGRLVYMLAAMPAMALVGAFLNRHPTLVYRGYGAPARALGISAVADQQRAGAIMWVGGSVVLAGVVLWVATATLVAEERRMAARERAGDAQAADAALREALP